MFDIAGEPVGFFSAPLHEIAVDVENHVYQDDYLNNLMWIDLCPTDSMVKSPVAFPYFFLFRD